MKPKFLVPALCLSFFTACERPAPEVNVAENQRRAEEMRELDDRIARLQEMEDRAANRKVAETQEERDRLIREKEQLEAERDRLVAAREAAETQAARAAREARDADERAKDVASRAEEDRANAQIDFFYPALEPHGEWLEVDGLGYCWQPRAAATRGWRPYTDGRWVFTDYGWTWDSNEPFGWAAYHYGRWTKLSRIGWVWVPGTEWGPAWVAWRRSDDYIGWAPLPPDAWSATGFNAAVDSYYDIGPGSYSFVPADRLGARTYVGQVVAPEQNVTIINKTVNITNVTYKKVENTTVVYNAGPDFERVNRRAGEKIPRMKVERIAAAQASGKAGAAQKEGVLHMVAPRLQGGEKTGAKPQRVKERVKGETPDRGWSGAGNKAAVEQVRARVKQEARQAEEQERTGGARERRPTATPIPTRPTIPVATPRTEKATPPPIPAKPKQVTEEPARKPSPETPAEKPTAESTADPKRAREDQPRTDRKPAGERRRRGEPPVIPAKPATETPAPEVTPRTPQAPAPGATRATPEVPETATPPKAAEDSARDPAAVRERRRPRAMRERQEDGAAATPRKGPANEKEKAPATP